MEQSKIDYIKESHLNACEETQLEIEREHPEVFKKLFKIGDWVTLKEESQSLLICIESIGEAKAYGFNRNGTWATPGTGHWSFRTRPHIWKLATNQEVKDALEAETMRRGYRTGVRIDQVPA